ncbi:MAG: CoA transferase [Actinobacteria bacterium]|nr:CoA transferase [Actinomycetota bacterium]
MTAATAGPLAGLRVVEAGSLIAGPFATRLMADFGAEVIKVESPRAPDPLRQWGQHHFEGRGLWWPVQARGKRLVTLDLGSGRGQELFADLVSRADVLIENFRPGTLERWNLDPTKLREANPGLIVARVSGFGQTGRYRERGGFASVAEAMGGLRYINGYPDRPPPRSGISLGDSLASMFALQGILMALYWRQASGGEGQEIDVSLVESCFALLESAAPEYDKLGAVREPTGTGLARLVPSNIYRSADGRWVVIAANTDALFRRLADALGLPALADDPRYASHDARADNQDRLEAVIAAWAGRHRAAEIDERMAAHGVPCGPLYSIADIFADPYFREREALVEAEDPEIGSYVAPGVHPRLSRTPGAVGPAAGWEAGRDNGAVLGELLGLSPREITELAEQGVV